LIRRGIRIDLGEVGDADDFRIGSSGLMVEALTAYT
jgi:hypothetical protein